MSKIGQEKLRVESIVQAGKFGGERDTCVCCWGMAEYYTLEIV